MARPKSDGLSYFPFDVDFFSDPKIRSVRARYGADGVELYIYLLCEIYRNKYYVAADEEFIDCTAIDLGMSVDKTRQMIAFFCKRSLFDGKLFMADTVLTAKSVQHRYQEARKGAKRDIFVEGKLWLLEKAETLGFIKVRPVDGFSEKNGDFSGKNSDNSGNYSTKESKVKENKGKESRTAAPPAPSPTREQLVRKYGEKAVALYEQKYQNWQQRKGISGGISYARIAEWLIADGVPEVNSSIDPADVMEELRKQYSEEGQNAD
jgi:hypothetical protein